MSDKTMPANVRELWDDCVERCIESNDERYTEYSLKLFLNWDGEYEGCPEYVEGIKKIEEAAK